MCFAATAHGNCDDEDGNRMEVGDKYVSKNDICSTCECTPEGLICSTPGCLPVECKKNEEVQWSTTVCCQGECVKKANGNKPN